MKARYARDVAEQSYFDSGALTPLCTLIHFIPEPGDYIGRVMRGADIVGSFRLLIVAEGAAPQVNIDLAEIRGTMSQAYLVRAPAGVVFYCSSGVAGRSVRLLTADGDGHQVVFDSKILGPEDLFTVTLLQPGKYAVTDEADANVCQVAVDQCQPGAKPYRVPTPAVASLAPSGTAEASAAPRLQQAQTQVFKADGRTRIKVQLEAPQRAESAAKPRKAQWRPPAE